MNNEIDSREVLARRIVENVGSLSVKLRELADDIRALWIEFERLPEGETILGCRTKKEFCVQHLHRTPRAVQYLLSGRTTPSEQCSPVLPFGEIDLAGSDGQDEGGPFYSLEALLDSAERAFEQSWKPGGDTETNRQAWDAAHKVGMGVGRVLENELEKASDSDDCETLAAIAEFANRLQIFHAALSLRAECEAGRLLNEMNAMGISNEGAVALINLPKEQLDALVKERIEELQHK